MIYNKVNNILHIVSKKWQPLQKGRSSKETSYNNKKNIILATNQVQGQVLDEGKGQRQS